MEGIGYGALNTLRQLLLDSELLRNDRIRASTLRVALVASCGFGITLRGVC